MKSEGVKDVVKWMEAELKKQKAEIDAIPIGPFTYSEGEYYDRERAELEAELRAMVRWKISTEKYMKKLQHQGE